MRPDLLSIIMGGVCGMIVLLVLRFWKKLKLTSLSSLGLILIFIPQALQLGRPGHLSMIIMDLVLSTIGVILIGIDIQRVMRKA
jgi:hypothetical protein